MKRIKTGENKCRLDCRIKTKVNGKHRIVDERSTRANSRHFGVSYLTCHGRGSSVSESELELSPRLSVSLPSLPFSFARRGGLRDRGRGCGEGSTGLSFLCSSFRIRDGLPDGDRGNAMALSSFSSACCCFSIMRRFRVLETATLPFCLAGAFLTACVSALRFRATSLLSSRF